jgi:hypothetical protein
VLITFKAWLVLTRSAYRIRRDLQSGHLVPQGDLWPRFLFQGFHYDPNDVWKGLFRSHLLVKVREPRRNLAFAVSRS